MSKKSDHKEYDPNAEPLDNIARGLFAIADALGSIAFHIKYLGGGDNASQMGAVEFLAVQVKEGAAQIAAAIGEHE